MSGNLPIAIIMHVCCSMPKKKMFKCSNSNFQNCFGEVEQLEFNWFCMFLIAFQQFTFWQCFVLILSNYMSNCVEILKMIWNSFCMVWMQNVITFYAIEKFDSELIVDFKFKNIFMKILFETDCIKFSIK